MYFTGKCRWKDNESSWEINKSSAYNITATEKIITYKQYYEYFVFQGKLICPWKHIEEWEFMGYTKKPSAYNMTTTLKIITHLTL